MRSTNRTRGIWRNGALAFAGVAVLLTCCAASDDAISNAGKTEQHRPGIAETKAIAEEGFIYGLPIVMNYAVMYEYAVDRNSGQYKAPFNQISNEARVFTYKDTAISRPTATRPIPSSGWTCAPSRSCCRFRPWINPATTRCSSATATRSTTAISAAAPPAARPGDYMVVGPDWKGETPAGIKQVFRSSTQFSLAIYPHPAFQCGRHAERGQGPGGLQGATTLGVSSPARTAGARLRSTSRRSTRKW